ncbi:MAG: hypothetical protein QG671_2371 [Actinomycetota bacterium]|nr:hypothetical protein [Actinomycetota bacterium]
MTADDLELARGLLTDGFSRTADALPHLLADLSPADLLWQPDPGSNSIAWLTWHLTRVQDDHLAGVGRVDQVWSTQGWADRFNLPYPRASIGFGQVAAEVAAFGVSDRELLLGYHAATQAMTRDVLAAMDHADFDRVVDERWDPPVTAAVRLVSVVDDTAQHTGQIGYLRGLLQRRG